MDAVLDLRLLLNKFAFLACKLLNLLFQKVSLSANAFLLGRQSLDQSNAFEVAFHGSRYGLRCDQPQLRRGKPKRL